MCCYFGRFQYFHDTYEAKVKEAKSKGNFEDRIVTLKVSHIREASRALLHVDAASGVPANLISDNLWCDQTRRTNTEASCMR